MPETTGLAAENSRLLAKNARLIEVAERLLRVTDDFIHDEFDPGAEAMAAVWCARQELQRP